MQVEALAKLRRGGEQTVRVEHVHVYPGGQAVVGNVTHHGRPGVGGGSKMCNNPMDLRTSEPWQLRLAPRCGARTRRGSSRQSPTVRGRTRCRLHGGAKGSGAPSGSRNGNYRHGQGTRAAIAERKALRALLSQSSELLAAIADAVP